MAKTRKPTKKTLEAAEKKLREDREELLRQLSELDRRTFEGGSGTNDGGEEDIADLGSDTFERERELQLSENLRDLLDQVEHALTRIDDGSYGECESCGKSIEAARLKALPYASLCIDCKRREERR